MEDYTLTYQQLSNFAVENSVSFIFRHDTRDGLRKVDSGVEGNITLDMSEAAGHGGSRRFRRG